MKKVCFVGFCLLVIVFVTGCFSRSGDSAGSADLEMRTFTSFEIGIPGDWSKIERERWANTIPEETVAVFAKKDESGFIRNVNVLKERLGTDASSIEYAKANELLGSKALFDYRKVEGGEVEIGGERTVLHLFNARNSSTDRLHFFTQAYFMKDSSGYTVTCIAENGESEAVDQCDSVVRSFKFR
jgi:hypothetical protein